MIDINTYPLIYWSNKSKIDLLERMLIVHSILYYQLDKPVISDKDYDELSRMFMSLKSEDENAFEDSMYFYCFEEYDGSSGFDLFDLLSESDKEYLTKIAKVVSLRR